MAATPQLKRLHLTSPGRGSDEAKLREAIQAKLTYVLGKTRKQRPMTGIRRRRSRCATASSTSGCNDDAPKTKRQKKKRVYYLSIEFLIGRLLFDALTNLRLVEPVRARAREPRRRSRYVCASVEPDAALGNGGLGRLAACFMDSMSALGDPRLRLRHPLRERTVRAAHPRRLAAEAAGGLAGAPAIRGNSRARSMHYPIGFGGMVEYIGGDDATARAIWYPAETVLAVPYDTPIAGWRGRHVNTLRLWSARGADPIQLSALQSGRSSSAPLPARARAEAISRVLYPNDATPEGQELRLRQEYFFTSASLQDIVRRHLDEFGTLDNRCASMPRSSSTTRIRRSRSPN